jgi:hypothetical protein
MREWRERSASGSKSAQVNRRDGCASGSKEALAARRDVRLSLGSEF